MTIALAFAVSRWAARRRGISAHTTLANGLRFLPGAGFVGHVHLQKVSRWPRPAAVVCPETLASVRRHRLRGQSLQLSCGSLTSGEIDGQREAAELMNRAMAQEGIELVPYHRAKKLLTNSSPTQRKKSPAVSMPSWTKGVDPMPKKVRPHDVDSSLQTIWRGSQLMALSKHWARARVDAEIVSPEPNPGHHDECLRSHLYVRQQARSPRL